MRATLTLLALALLAGCSKPGGPTNPPSPANVATNAAVIAPPPAAAPDPRLAKVFTQDILGANVSFLETITGPAFKSEGADRLYKVGDCQVIVGTAKAKIANIGITNYGPGCSFNIAQYFASGYDHPVPNLPTFGDIKQGFGGAYDADCLALCGNAADPVVTLTYQGSHADNFTDLLAEVPVVADPVLNAWQDWSGKLSAKYGQDYVTSGKYHAGDSLPDVAEKDFAAIRPTTIRVGSNLPTLEQQ